MKHRTKRRLMIGCVVALAVLCMLASFSRDLPVALAPLGLAFQLTTVLFSALPALGLAWFVWHMLLSRRIRLQRLRRVRRAQGRTTNFLAPAPLFGAACKKADDAIDRDRSE